MPAKKSTANIALGHTMRQLRRERGYSQESFARRAGVDRSYYGAIERGEFNVGIDMIVKIAAGLGEKPSKLLRVADL
jgi:transcriptional regulator with XRE-family HTH domain